MITLVLVLTTGYVMPLSQPHDSMRECMDQGFYTLLHDDNVDRFACVNNETRECAEVTRGYTSLQQEKVICE